MARASLSCNQIELVIMKKMKFLVLLLLLGMTISQVDAQRMSHQGAPLESVVELSETQQTEINKIKESYRTKFDALRQAEKTKANRTAMQQLMKEREAAVAAILTPEQRTKWEAAQTEQKAKMQQNRANRDANHEKMQAARTEMNAYHEKNVKPVLQKQRAKLESKISAADKKLIAEMRTQHEQRHQESGDRRGDKGSKWDGKEKRGDKASAGKEAKSDRKYAQTKALVEKYSANIDALYAEIATQEKQWEQDKKAIWEKYATTKSDEKADKSATHHGEGGKDKSDSHKKIHFLLLDPNATTTTAKPAPINRKVEAFPNPAGAMQNLEFEVLQAGKVKVEIIDGQGNMVKSVFDGNLEQGINKLQVTTGDLKGKSYFYRITDAKGTTTKGFIIQ